jgi:hypothetical protein
VWAMVAAFVKNFNVTFEFALYGISYENILLYSETLPSYSSKKDGKKSDEKVFNADDPKDKEAFDKLLGIKR